MTMKKIPDFYKILQVDPEAEPELIKAAYRKLSAMYHPDNSSSASFARRMAAINEAYEVLSDTARRSRYHRDWLEYYSNRRDYVNKAEQTSVPNEEIQYNSATDVMEDFFYALQKKNWDSAYLKLTEEDRERVSAEEFCAWREAVDQCYEMQEYKIDFDKIYHNCQVEQAVYKQVAEFQVEIMDMDTITTQTSVETLHKYAAFDGVSWKVCLGTTSVKQMTLKFQLLAERKKNYDPMQIYKSAVARTDSLTGLLSGKGFLEEAEREAYRSKRYGNTFSVLALQITPEKAEKEAACICHLADVVKNSIRKSDVAGCISDNQIVCLLVETRKDQALLAGKKILKLAKAGQDDRYEIRVGIAEYARIANVEECIYSACSAAGAAQESGWIRKK